MADLSPLALAEQILAAHKAGRVDHDLETTALILAAEVKRLDDLRSEVTKALERFRDFVADNGGVRNLTTSQGEPTNHHNRIWSEIAGILAATSARATSKGAAARMAGACSTQAAPSNIAARR